MPLGHRDGGAIRSFVNKLRCVIPGFSPAALVTVVVVIGIGVASTLWLRADPFLRSNGFYSTAVGQQQSTTLADGSVVLLNTNSQIKVNYNNEYRDIRLLQGEAHFTVAENAAYPFRVYAGNGRIEAVGTAFSVYLKDTTIDVTVTEGVVVLASVNHPKTNRLLVTGTPPDADQLSGSNTIVGSGLVET